MFWLSIAVLVLMLTAALAAMIGARYLAATADYPARAAGSTPDALDPAGSSA
jgi:hypothetical protein